MNERTSEQVSEYGRQHIKRIEETKNREDQVENRLPKGPFELRKLVVNENLILLLKTPFVVSQLCDEALFGLLQLGYVLRCGLASVDVTAAFGGF